MAASSTKYQQMIRDTAAVLSAANRIYPLGWIIFESDTTVVKEADGLTAYNSLPAKNADSSTSTKGLVKLSVAPATSTNPVAAGTNDPRMSDARQPLSHTHAQSEITNLTTDLGNKQATLVSGTNIKTVNGSSILGSGDLTISGGSADTQSTLTYAATTNIDFSNADAVRILSLTGNVTFTTSNKAAAKSKTIVIAADASTRTLTFPAGWIWLDQPAPTSLAASKTAVLSLYVKGTAETDVIASYSAQL